MDIDSPREITESREKEAEEATVLLVDDERLLREAYAELLEEKFTVIAVGDGEAALAAMTDDIDAIVLDRQMPGLSGDEVLERLRGDGYDVPVAIVSAINPDLEETEQQTDAYLFKPVNREELLAAVERLLLPR